MHLYCKFHMRALESYAGLNSLKPFISKLLMCDLDRFSKIQSHLHIDMINFLHFLHGFRNLK